MINTIIASAIIAGIIATIAYFVDKRWRNSPLKWYSGIISVEDKLYAISASKGTRRFRIAKTKRGDFKYIISANQVIIKQGTADTIEEAMKICEKNK